MSRICAYCGRKGVFSREHVWPKCFIERVDYLSAHYSPTSGNVHGADYVVKDVCQTCNNEKLSKLDQYFCDLYDEYFKSPRGPNSKVIFRYDYNLLSRVLLKIAYNTARSAGSETAPFQSLKKYILEGTTCPSTFAIIAELVSPAYLVDNSSGITIVKEIPTIGYRSARAKLKTPHGHLILVRIVSINSFFFHLLIAKEKNVNINLLVSEFLEYINGTVFIDPNSTSVILYSTHRTSLRSQLPLLLGKFNEFKKYFEKNRKESS